MCACLREAHLQLLHCALCRLLPPHIPCSSTYTPQERNAAVIRAEGESESARLISEATKQAGQGLIELRRIEAARDIAETLSRSPNVVYMPSGNQILMNMGTGGAR